MQNSSDPFQLTRFFDKLRTALSSQKRGFYSPLLSEREKGQGDELGILIACSGGIDSLALVYLMNDVKNELELRLGVCYVNHKFRSESADEAKFVDKICQKLEIPFFSGSFPDDFWKETTNNFEEKARTGRYEILEEIAINNNFGYIATAHHRDDQVETVLMRIFERGTGIKGLCGIKPIVTHPTNPIPRPLSLSKKERGESPLFSGKRGVGGELGELSEFPSIIRPLLDIPKCDIVNYMAGRQYLSDQTNNDTHYRRNYYRNIVVPALKRALPDTGFEKHISDLAENAKRERDVMEEMMREFWKNLTPDPLPTFPPTPFLKERGDSSPSLSGEGFRVRLPRTLIKAHSDDFWMTAFSYLFSFGDIAKTFPPAPFLKERGDSSPSLSGEGFRVRSHSTQTLKDITAFIRKTDPGTASYNPYIFKRDSGGVSLLRP